VGIVIETTKDSIKIIDTNNDIQIINNIDFGEKVEGRHFVAKNKCNDEIKEGALVMIRFGGNQVSDG
jgi:hypothetical protein